MLTSLYIEINLYQPNRHNPIVAVEGIEIVGHANPVYVF